MKYYIEGNNFILGDEANKFENLFKGCLGIFLIIISITLFIIVVFSFVISILTSNFKFSLLIFIPINLLIFSIILFINSINYLRNDYNPFIIIDKNNETIKFYKNKKILLYEINFRDISYILTDLIIEEDSEGFRDYLYNIYLIKKDNSKIWLHTTYYDKFFTEIVNKLIDFTGFALQDKTNLLSEKNQSKNYDKKIAYKLDYFYSIKETQEKNGIMFSIKNKKFKNILIPSFVIFFLFSLIFIIIELFLSKKFDISGILFSVIFIIFLLIFIFIILFKILSNTVIVASSEGIDIKTECRFLPFIKFKKFLPSQAIQNLTLNKNKEHIWSINIVFNQDYSETSKLYKVFEISEQIIGSHNYYNNNFIFELDYLIRKINEILRKNI